MVKVLLCICDTIYVTSMKKNENGFFRFASNIQTDNLEHLAKLLQRVLFKKSLKIYCTCFFRR